RHPCRQTTGNLIKNLIKWRHEKGSTLRPVILLKGHRDPTHRRRPTDRPRQFLDLPPLPATFATTDRRHPSPLSVPRPTAVGYQHTQSLDRPPSLAKVTILDRPPSPVNVANPPTPVASQPRQFLRRQPSSVTVASYLTDRHRLSVSPVPQPTATACQLCQSLK
ncbi:hypothetical protein Tcan_00612, partial [Toxocara canis]